MRFPKRLRGLALGVVTLAASPLVVALWTSSTSPASTPRPVAAVSVSMPMHTAERAERLVVHPMMLRLHAPIPPPPPPPAPAPTPKPRPRPAVSVPTVTVAPNSVEGIIRAAAARHGVSGDWMVRIARCESGLRPNAYNPRGPYIGLFQFLQSTFTHNGGTNIWDAADQSEVAARMLANGQAHQWSCA